MLSLKAASIDERLENFVVSLVRHGETTADGLPASAMAKLIQAAHGSNAASILADGEAQRQAQGAEPGKMPRRERALSDLPLLNSPSSRLTESALDDMIAEGLIDEARKQQYLHELALRKGPNPR